MKKSLVMFYFEIVAFFISSVSILGVPFVLNTETGEINILTYVIGGVFWLGLLVGVILNYQISIQRKKFLQREKISVEKTNIPVITFFSNKVAVVVDVIFAVSIVVLLLSLFLFKNSLLQDITLFITVFTFEIHLLFNSENYKYINNKIHKGV